MFEKYLYGFPYLMDQVADEGGSGAGDASTGDGGADTGAEGGDQSTPDTQGDAPTGDQVDQSDNASAGDGGTDTGAEGGDQSTPFPDDWREQMSKGDDKMLKALKRFNSPLDLNKSYQALQQKISTGELRSPLSKDATEEQVAAFRKENGIPDDSKGYLEKLPDGVVFGDDDMPVVSPFLDKMHEQNVSPDVVNSALQSYIEAQEQQAQIMQERDQEIVAQTEDELRAEWGGDYRANIGAVNGFIDTAFPAEFKENLMNARLGDGTPLSHHPDFLRGIASMGRIVAPSSAVAHGNGTETMDSVDNRIAEIKKTMGNKNSDYWKDGGKTEKEYRDLLTLKEKMVG